MRFEEFKKFKTVLFGAEVRSAGCFRESEGVTWNACFCIGIDRQLHVIHSMT